MVLQVSSIAIAEERAMKREGTYFLLDREI
jgi:hypothetical protein